MKTIIMAFAILLAVTATFAQAKQKQYTQASQLLLQQSIHVLCTRKL